MAKGDKFYFENFVTCTAISKEAATSLMLGMVTDTGRFRYRGVGSRVFELCSILMKYDLDLEKLIEIMAINPRERFGLPAGESFSVWRLDEEFTVDPNEFLSMGRATPFAGMRLCGKNLLTINYIHFATVPGV